jgi:hypothetical protein
MKILHEERKQETILDLSKATAAEKACYALWGLMYERDQWRSSSSRSLFKQSAFHKFPKVDHAVIEAAWTQWFNAVIAD